MRIVQIVLGLSSGGAERFVVDLSNELSKYNDVILLMLKDSSINNNNFYLSELYPSVEYLNAGTIKGLTLRQAYSIYKTIYKLKPDIVHIHLPTTAIYILPAILFKRKIKYIETIHSQADKLTISLIGHKIKSLLFKTKLLTPCTISDMNKVLFEKFYQINNTHLIYNGRSIPNKSKNFSTIHNDIQQLKKSKEDLLFLHVGRCIPVKNQSLLINVFNRLQTEGVPCQLLIIGDGFDNSLGRSLKSIAKDNIHFFSQQNNIADYFYSCDAFCLSSLYEGMPISLIESFACGCIPISTPVSGSSDLIINGINGFISNKIAEDEYYNSVIEFISNRDNINKINLTKTYNERFSIELCAKKYNKLYLDLTNK